MRLLLVALLLVSCSRNLPQYTPSTDPVLSARKIKLTESRFIDCMNEEYIPALKDCQESIDGWAEPWHRKLTTLDAKDLNETRDVEVSKAKREMSLKCVESAEIFDKCVKFHERYMEAVLSSPPQ